MEKQPLVVEIFKSLEDIGKPATITQIRLNIISRNVALKDSYRDGGLASVIFNHIKAGRLFYSEKVNSRLRIYGLKKWAAIAN